MDRQQIIARFSTWLHELTTDKRILYLPPLPSCAGAAIALAHPSACNHTVVWITDGPQSLDSAHHDLLTLLPLDSTAPPPLYFPAWESLPNSKAQDPEITGCRLNVLLTLTDPTLPRLMVTCVQALMQKTLSPTALSRNTVTLKVSADHDLEALTATLTRTGYEFTHEVTTKGQASLRGGILDAWPVTGLWPVRIEFLGPTVESIRRFNPVNQKSVDKTDTIVLPPAGEWLLMQAASKNGAPPLAWIPDDTAFLWSDLTSITEHASLYEDMLKESDALDHASLFNAVRLQVGRRDQATQLIQTSLPPASEPLPTIDIRAVDGALDVPRETLPPDMLEASRQRLAADLGRRASEGQQVILFFDTPGALDHFRSQNRDLHPSIALLEGSLSGGMVSDSLGLVIVSESDLYGRRKQAGRRYDPWAGRPRPEHPSGVRVADLTDLEPGDLVVHAEHGIGRYLGLHDILFNDQRQEVITIEYADEARLHVPVSQAHLLSRYVGVSRHHVQLHRLGGKRWNTEKADAEKAVLDLAASLLETQAHRNVLGGHAFPSDTPWQHDMEAAFPYQETTDQTRVIAEVKADMESTRPMDRLICGNAGYGKTEVAMRAAFKVVMAGKQVAVLVPTTVLAQQHFETFSERLSAYPVRIEMLSRFVSDSRHSSVTAGLADGTVNIVIGTHALVQPSIRFKDLGLVIIDEEQRFGVAHKERLKLIRQLVNVLTLTATPIPRTLYMSLTGARDMSLLQTPPRERMAIETIIAQSSDKVVRDAILRELGREGQVFFLHNRVMTIELVRQRLARIVPEARVEVAHGQMAAGELSDVMHRFVSGQFDVLLCTTIIESGVNIPRANTILIDRADRFGIADLYQLRGRVGRSNHKAYAYLLIPAHGRVNPDARERIGAVKKFSSLSAGFQLAMRNLELRGAGSLLGAAQSGHITAVGFGLYCQLLRAAVARLKGEPVPRVIDTEVRLDFISLSSMGGADANGTAIIPYTYIEDERLRVAAYRRMAEAVVPAEIDTIGADLRDRYGELPSPVTRLLALARVRVAAAFSGIRSVETRGERLMLNRGGDDYLMKGGRFPRLTGTTPDDRLAEVLDLIATSAQWSSHP